MKLRTNTGTWWYHGSREGSLDFENGYSNFGGGLFLARDKIYARDYAAGRSYENVFAVRLRKGSRIFRPSSKASRRKLAKWLLSHYPETYPPHVYPKVDGLADDLLVEDLQSNSLYDNSEVQEGLESLGYRAVRTNEEALVLDPLVTVVGVRRLDDSGRISKRVNPSWFTWGGR